MHIHNKQQYLLKRLPFALILNSPAML